MSSDLVTDTSFWKDLSYGEILFAAFELEYTWHITDIAVNKLQQHLSNQTPSLFSSGLSTDVLSGELVKEVMNLSRSLISAERKFRDMSIADLSAFVLAKEMNAWLITSDKSLRNYAERNGLTVHGTLWVLDQLVEEKGILKPAQGEDAIEKMQAFPNRLPTDECKNRITRWRKRTI